MTNAMDPITERTERSSADEADYMIPPPPRPSIEGFKDEYSKKKKSRRVSSRSKDALSVGSSFYNDSSDELGSSVYGGDDKKKNRDPKIAEQESKHVFWSKVLVGLVLLGSTALMGYATYRFVKNEEVAQFENQVSSSRIMLVR